MWKNLRYRLVFFLCYIGIFMHTQGSVKKVQQVAILLVPFYQIEKNHPLYSHA